LRQAVRDASAFERASSAPCSVIALEGRKAEELIEAAHEEGLARGDKNTIELERLMKHAEARSCSQEKASRFKAKPLVLAEKPIG
jgi:hypothetical protein